ncbi:thioredoxin domain-containing protein [Streptomyces sp. B15]|uniref:DsbA family protein n=1 Tax=Streptomyces sp. B15 TaxID=1537797 RepID=UPI001B37DF88|nr:thioredoxin domain-containing protein [Streptomyces sp. B15]MBQ1122755.1 thioredoxin domain-containing protein [Streptomyces sp. B15]
MSITPEPARRRRIVLATAVLALALVVSAVLLTTGEDGRSSGEKKPSPTQSSTSGTGAKSPSGQGPDLRQLARREAHDSMAKGRHDAPVVLIEYADFQCPFCGRFARETEPQLIRDYVRNGTLRIEWRNFPVFGQESEQAALASWAAGRQKKFWDFHRLLYSQPRERNSGTFAKESLIDFARRAGVPDLKRFRRDMDSSSARKALARDREEGYGLGVTSTPAFLVNNTPILGAQSTRTFENAIKKAARKAGKETTR